MTQLMMIYTSKKNRDKLPLRLLNITNLGITPPITHQHNVDRIVTRSAGKRNSCKSRD